MHTLRQTISVLLLCSVNTLVNGQANASCPEFPSSLVEFSSSFSQPAPPLVGTEFKANFLQHKWDVNLSHITAGFIYNSPTQKKVRVDEAYDLVLATSLFDFANISAEGLVNNVLRSWSPSIVAAPQTFTGYVNSDFPLWTSDTLVSSGAVFGGLVNRPMNGQVASWDILYQGAIPVTVFVDKCNTVVGYDYFAPERRTRVITEYFNIILGAVDSSVFD